MTHERDSIKELNKSLAHKGVLFLDDSTEAQSIR
jgi:polysaccharide deacetylase 2 family uncharacterized protein YibQ